MKIVGKEKCKTLKKYLWSSEQAVRMEIFLILFSYGEISLFLWFNISEIYKLPKRVG